MKRVFKQDVRACGRCGGKLKMIATIHPPENKGPFRLFPVPLPK